MPQTGTGLFACSTAPSVKTAAGLTAAVAEKTAAENKTDAESLIPVVFMFSFTSLYKSCQFRRLPVTLGAFHASAVQDAAPAGGSTRTCFVSPGISENQLSE